MKTTFLFVLSLALATVIAQAASGKKVKTSTPAKAPQPQTLVIESPKSGGTVSGTVDVVVRGMEVFQQIAASVPGATHVKLTPAEGDSSRWVGKIDTTLNCARSPHAWNCYSKSGSWSRCRLSEIDRVRPGTREMKPRFSSATSIACTVGGDTWK